MLDDIIVSQNEPNGNGLVGRLISIKTPWISVRPTAGRVLLDGVPVHSAPRDHRLQVGIAFQYPEDQIFQQTVFREVAFGPRNLGLDEAEVTARVHWALEIAGLNPETMSQRMPFTLSGGEMRRVALAGILALRPRVLILDEPTAGQDPQSRRGLLARILAWQQETGLTLIIISHALEELVLSPSTDPSLRSGLRLRINPAEGLGQAVERLVMLKEGRVVADGPTQRILSDEALLNTIGLDVPEPIRLLRALRQKGKKVRTDLVSTAERPPPKSLTCGDCPPSLFPPTRGACPPSIPPNHGGEERGGA